MKLLSRLVFTLGFFLLSFEFAQAAVPTTGLLITHVSSQQWQLRLITSTTVERFSGVVESDRPITGVQAYRLESIDNAKLLTSTSLSATFAVWPGGSDGVSFNASSGAKLCLRDTGSTGVQMYLGSTLRDAVPVTAPVALAGTDACGDTTTTPPTSFGARKFHPGHWIALGRKASTQAIMQSSIKPGVVGMVKRYTWRSMEPTEGAYDFSELASDLNWAAANGMQLIAMIEDKTFVLERPNPAYLDAYTPHNRAGGYTVARWLPAVVARFNALVRALGARFDSNSNFEGIATQETSLSLDSPELKSLGYTPELYRDAYINTLTASTASLPTSRVFWFMNFLVGKQSYLADIASAVAGKGVVMGGPDVWPDNASLESGPYPLYTKFFGKMPLFGQVEDVCYNAPHLTSGYQTKYWTMPELFNFARTTMHVNYMFWVRVPKPSPADSYDWNDALPVIAANPTFTP